MIHVPTALWAHTLFDLAAGTVKRSCVHFVQPDGRIIPFDTFNTFYRAGAAGANALVRGRGEAL